MSEKTNTTPNPLPPHENQSPPFRKWIDFIDQMIGGLCAAGIVEEDSVDGVAQRGWDWQSAWTEWQHRPYTASETTHEFLIFLPQPEITSVVIADDDPGIWG